MSLHEGTPAASDLLRAIRIDPDHRQLELIHVDPLDVAGSLGASIIETVDFDNDHCLVIDDGALTPARHPRRFRFAKGPTRPFFGPVLILGIRHGNWIAATMTVKAAKAHIIWEEWDGRERHYAEAALESA